MKKVLFLIALLFSVVCYAAPPPEIVVDWPENNQVVTQTDFAVVNFEVQEVAFSYIGNYDQLPEICQYAEELRAFSLPAVTVRKCRTMINYKPPSINIAKSGFRINYQHSNYGYPFTGDIC